MSNLSLALSSISLPNISEDDLANQQSIRQILEYLMVLDKSLKFYLSHIDADNLTDEFRREITDATEGMTQLVQTMTDLEAGLSSTRKQTAEGFEQMVTKDTFNSFAQQTAEGFLQTVSKDGIISAINQTAETIRIQAARIVFEGLVTANRNFLILEDGSIVANNGIFTGTINALFGTIGGMTVNNNGFYYNGYQIIDKIGNLFLPNMYITGGSGVPYIGSRGTEMQFGINGSNALAINNAGVTVNPKLNVNGDIYLSQTAVASLKTLLNIP